MPGRIAALITIVAVFRILGSLIGPAWGSLVSDYLPENRRGQYFGWRSQVVGVSGVAGMILWGVLLSTLSGSSGALGFFVLFLLAGVFRAASFYFMSRMTDLPIHTQVDSDFSFWMFIRRFRESNFVKFVFYVSSITFATQLSAAYFSVYMLRDLKLDYMTYMTVHLASVLTGLIAFPLWGRHADMAGNAKILKINSVLIPIIPILWAFAQNPLHLVLVEIFAGFVWCGFNLCATNFIFDAVQPAKRVRCLGYFNLINGTATFLGASAGGFLAERLPAFRGSPLVTLFLVSGALRFAGDFFLARHFREVRVLDVKYRSAELVLSVLGIRPVSGRNVEMEVFPLFLLRPFIGRKKTRPPAAS
jgi:MFS family permease